MANAGQSQQTGDASALRLDALEGAVNGINDRFDTFSDDIVARLQIELPQLLQALQGGGGGQHNAAVVGGGGQLIGNPNVNGGLGLVDPNAAANQNGVGGNPGVGGGVGGGVRERRPIDTSRMDKLQGDVTLANFKLWRNRWIDFFNINRIGSYPATEQTAALRMVLDISMQKIVEFSIGI